MNSLLCELMPIFWQKLSLMETVRNGINDHRAMLHLQISSSVLALACWELHPEYRKHLLFKCGISKGIFFNNNCYFNVTLQSFLQSRFQKRKGEEAHIGAFPKLYKNIGFGGYLLL